MKVTVPLIGLMLLATGATWFHLSRSQQGFHPVQPAGEGSLPSEVGGGSLGLTKSQGPGGQRWSVGTAAEAQLAPASGPWTIDVHVVADLSGQPIRGVGILGRAMAGSWTSGEEIDTDLGGLATLEVPALVEEVEVVGTWRSTTRVIDRDRATVHRATHAGKHELRLVLSPGNWETRLLVDATDERPLASFDVDFIRGERIVFATTSNAVGEFQVPAFVLMECSGVDMVGDRAYHGRGGAGPLASAGQGFVVPIDFLDDSVLSLPVGPTFRLGLTGPREAIGGRISLILGRPDDDRWLRARARMDADGPWCRFRSPFPWDEDPGEWIVLYGTSEDGRYMGRGVAPRVAGTHERTLELHLLEATRFRGRLLSASEAVPSRLPIQLTTRIRGFSGVEIRQVADSKADGSFDIVLVPGPVRVAVSNSFCGFFSQEFDLEPGPHLQDLQLRLPPGGPVSGAVFAPGSGLPISGIVRLKRLNDDTGFFLTSRFSSPENQVVSDASFVFPHVKDGSYELSIQLDGSNEWTATDLVLVPPATDLRCELKQ
jgi:hypothetical protein